MLALLMLVKVFTSVTVIFYLSHKHVITYSIEEFRMSSYFLAKDRIEGVRR